MTGAVHSDRQSINVEIAPPIIGSLRVRTTAFRSWSCFSCMCLKGRPQFDLMINFYALSGGTHKGFPGWSDISKGMMGVRVKNFIAASILSCLIAGAICASTSPVNSVAGVAISVNRDAKGDRLPLLPAVQPSRRDSIKNEKPASKKSLVGCEPAFSAFAHPAHAQIFTHCAA
jgi:hypothetical protein